jgi:MFS family permease
VSDPFAIPDDDSPPTLDAARADVHVIIVAVVLLVFGLPGLACAGLMPVVGPFGAANDPEFQDLGNAAYLVGFAMGAVAGGFVAMFAGTQVAGGFGLLMGRKWGWIAALVGLTLYTGGCLMPFAMYGYWALLRDRVRKPYLDSERSTSTT